LARRLRLGRDTGCWCGRDNSAARACLNDRLRCWCCLCARSRCHSHATSNYCGGGDAEPGAGDEIATRDYRADVFVNWFVSDWLGRLTC
jgi:hypothetical protein